MLASNEKEKQYLVTPAIHLATPVALSNPHLSIHVLYHTCTCIVRTPDFVFSFQKYAII